jgi:hypothetical protein
MAKPEKTSWSQLQANQIGYALGVSTGPLAFTSSGHFGGATLTLMGSADGRDFHTVTSPMRGPRKGRLENGVTFIKPMVHGGSAGTSISVSVGR